MKKLFFILYFILIFEYYSFSQGFTNHWVMGYGNSWGLPYGGTNVDFVGSNLSIYYKYRTMDLNVTNAVLSDSSGGLLFYSNGKEIADSMGNTMPNGVGLNPGSFTNNYPKGLPIIQGNIFIPLPGNQGKYYLFHETCTYAATFTQPLELFYSIIDMNQNGGLGDVITKNNIVLTDTLFPGELNATRHANGRDWWLLFRKVNSNKFYKLLITPYGISINYQNIGAFRDLYGNGAGDFSPDGSKFSYYNPKIDVEIYDFDRCSGMLSNYINIPINDSALLGSVAFSGDSKKLYVSSWLYVYQFDLTATNVASTMQTVAVWDGFYSPVTPFATFFLLAELGPDNKIYINCGNSTVDIHVINNPDSLGLACDVQQHSIHLATYNAYTIPNHPNYYLGAITGSTCDSLTGINTYSYTVIPIKINPNPAQDVFYLNYTLPYGITAVATVYNTLGEALMKMNLYWYFGYLQVDCSGLGNGVYFVEVETKGYSGTAKLVIAR